jgi:hypothetical protein
MKKLFTKIQKNFLLSILLLMSCISYGQTNTYNMYLNNISYTSCTTMEFDIWLEWTGTNTQKLQFFQAGINFNYNQLANGGIITGEFVQGSADTSLPSIQQIPNWSINQSSKQIRMLAQIASPPSTALSIPAPPGIRMGTFRLTNTVDFSAGAVPDFTWTFSSGTSSTTETKLNFYLAGATTATNVVDENSQFVTGNPAFNPNCTAYVPEIFSAGISDLSISPNPSNGPINLAFYSSANLNLMMEICDYTGRSIQTENLEVLPGKNTKEIYTDNFGKGVYLLSFKRNGISIFTTRLLIE